MAEQLKSRLRALEAKRETLFLRINNLNDLTKNLTDPKCLNSFRVLYTSLEATRTLFAEVMDDLVHVNLQIDKAYVPDYQPLNAFEEIYCNVKYAAEVYLKSSLSNASTSASDTVPRISEPKVKLPPIKIPTFSGNISNWKIFYETFKTLIHDNQTLSDIEKVQYLVGHLSGTALSVCSGLPPTAANYQLMFELLVERYEDKRTIAEGFANRIFNFKPLKVASHKSLNLFVEQFYESVAALKQLGIEDLADFLLLFIALKKLDPETARLFEQSVNQKGIPSYETLIEFVKSQAKVLSRGEPTDSHLKPKNMANSTNCSNSFFVEKTCENEINFKAIDDHCKMCKKDDHPIFRCSKFLEVTPYNRFLKAKENNLCINCLSSRHKTLMCKSKASCPKCKQKHHALLHFDSKPNLASTSKHNDPIAPNSSDKITSLTHCSVNINCLKNSNTVLLSTAIVHIIDGSGTPRPVRVLLDSASQSSFLTEACRYKLNLPKIRLNSSVRGIGQVKGAISGITNFTFVSRFDNDAHYTVSALLIDKITERLPNAQLKLDALDHLRHIPLADDKFYEPGEVHGLIGAEVYPYIVGPGKRHGPPGTPVAIESSLGYIVMGRAPTIDEKEELQSFCTYNTPNIETLLNRFWELEEVNPTKFESVEDENSEALYVKNVTRDIDGRFMVALPFHSDPSQLGDSFNTAKRRLLSLEKRLESSPDIRVQYYAFMADYLKKGFMEPAKDSNIFPMSYYLPHHCVLKPDSSSTKLRVVFDASCKTTSNKSLNDLLYTGKKLHNSLFSILLNFRIHVIAFTADIRQMYLQILMKPEHRNFQKILWRFSPEDPIKIYNLTTVAFGVKSSPFLAIRTLHELVNREGGCFPLASKSILENFYIDDVACSIENEELATVLYHQLVNLLKLGGFELVKWSSNSARFLESIPDDYKLLKSVDLDRDASFLKVLGLHWEATEDVLTFKVNIGDIGYTKRHILSTVAKIFDPLGLISPATLLMKLLIKELWHLKIDWDDPIPINIENTWHAIVLELKYLEEFKISRFLGITKSSVCDLIGFCDASLKAYGAVLYIRVQEGDKYKTTLLCSKSKVAPMKIVSIPRLELCSALCLGNLIESVVKTFNNSFPINNIYAISDSTVTLHWLSSPPSRWKPFVANRVSQIQEMVPSSHWYHVAGEENPADCLSRGLTPSSLMSHPLWYNGPPWLSLPSDEWPLSHIARLPDCSDISESKPIVLLTTDYHFENSIRALIGRISCYNKLLRVTVVILKMLKILPRSHSVSASDLNRAEVALIRVTQLWHFSEEIKLLHNKKPSTARIRNLNPFVDNDGLLRVGGRISNAALSYEQKHPYLLPKKDPFVNLIIQHYHKINLHTGAYLTLTVIRQRFWILSARSVVRSIVQKCVLCFRSRPKPTYPLMGDLPSCRVNSAKPFLHTGVDYAGPLQISMTRRRGGKTTNAYISLFVCLTTKAIHLELVSDLSTDCFLQAFKRFISRRGPVSVIYSDCGKNFIGAKSKLDKLYELIDSEEYKAPILNELSVRRIEWRFNPPYSPHMGGLWEANVKAVKTHLFKVIGSQILSYEELATVLTQIEALLNSRPLCTLPNSEPDSPEALTPAHFLTLRPLHWLPAENVEEVQLNRLDRYHLTDRIVQDYWRRWSTEYLTTLQARSRWNSPSNPLKAGMVVVLKRENTPPLHWPLGIITEVFPGGDGIVRVVSVKTRDGIYTRPVVKVCPLPVE